MTPKEIGQMIRNLREGKKVVCPECGKGIVKTEYDPKTTYSFHCDKCKFAINMEPVKK